MHTYQAPPALHQLHEGCDPATPPTTSRRQRPPDAAAARRGNSHQTQQQPELPDRRGEIREATHHLRGQTRVQMGIEPNLVRQQAPARRCRLDS